MCPQETLGTPEEEQKPQSTISALRRSFLESGVEGGMTEWEKRLASSPLHRLDDSPMIEPLEPDEVSGRGEETAQKVCYTAYRSCLPVQFCSSPWTGTQLLSHICPLLEDLDICYPVHLSFCLSVCVCLPVPLLSCLLVCLSVCLSAPSLGQLQLCRGRWAELEVRQPWFPPGSKKI